MDPITAVGLIGSILSIIDYGYKAVSTAAEIYSSATGATTSDEELARIATHIRDISVGLAARDESATRFSTISVPESQSTELRSLAEECANLAGDLLALVQSARAKEKGSKLETLKALFKKTKLENKRKDLERRLDRCIAALNLQLTAMSSDSSRQTLEKSISSTSQNMAGLQGKIGAIRESVAALSSGMAPISELDELLGFAERSVFRRRTAMILDSLRFDAMNDRVESVTAADTVTLSWVFDHDNDESEESEESEERSESVSGSFFIDEPSSRAPQEAGLTLQSWLKSGNGFFHIRGKPGSGKSTLMKFINGHEQAQSLLQEWANDKTIIMASHFFWRPGPPIMKSLDGMRRALLYRILNQQPVIIPGVFPRQWEETGLVLYRDFKFDPGEVSDALERLIKDESLLGNVRLFFLIDGLDEFEPAQSESHLTLTDLLRGWIERSDSRIKMLVSSRELPAFTFAGHSNFRLQDVTRRDIHHFVRRFTSTNPEFLSLQASDEFMFKLISTIVDRSEGVFLWVTLVLRDLRVRISEGTRDERDIYETLNATPIELEDLFMHILRSIKKVDLYYAYTAIRMAIQHPPYEFPLIYYYFSEDSETRHKTVKVGRLVASLQQLTEAEAVKRVRKDLITVRDKLAGRARGFLEVYTAPKDIDGNFEHRTIFSHPFFDEKVKIVHRSASDFFIKENVRQMLEAETGEFDGVFLACSALFQHISLVLQGEFPVFGWKALPDGYPTDDFTLGLPSDKFTVIHGIQGGLSSELSWAMDAARRRSRKEGVPPWFIEFLNLANELLMASPELAQSIGRKLSAHIRLINSPTSVFLTQSDPSSSSMDPLLSIDLLAASSDIEEYFEDDNWQNRELRSDKLFIRHMLDANLDVTAFSGPKRFKVIETLLRFENTQLNSQYRQRGVLGPSFWHECVKKLICGSSHERQGNSKAHLPQCINHCLPYKPDPHTWILVGPRYTSNRSGGDAENGVLVRLITGSETKEVVAGCSFLIDHETAKKATDAAGSAIITLQQWIDCFYRREDLAVPTEALSCSPGVSSDWIAAMNVGSPIHKEKGIMWIGSSPEVCYGFNLTRRGSTIRSQRYYEIERLMILSDIP